MSQEKIKPGDSIKVTIKNRSRFSDSPDKVGIGFTYSHGGLNNNATLFASIAWSDGVCSNSVLSRFDSVEKISIK